MELVEALAGSNSFYFYDTCGEQVLAVTPRQDSSLDKENQNSLRKTNPVIGKEARAGLLGVGLVHYPSVIVFLDLAKAG